MNELTLPEIAALLAGAGADPDQPGEWHLDFARAIEREVRSRCAEEYAKDQEENQRGEGRKEPRMTDRELLELAAKAAGMEYLADRPTTDCLLYVSDEASGNVAEWSPLNDDGDALRLAVKLNLTLRMYAGNTCAQSTMPGGPSAYVDEINHADPAAATRRAIVRAAAAIHIPKS